MVCSLHSVTTGSRDRANVPLIIIIMPERDGIDQGEDLPKASVLVLIRSPYLIRRSNVYCLSPRDVCLFCCFVSITSFFLPLKPRSFCSFNRSSIRMRPTATRNNLLQRELSVSSFFFFLFYFSLEMILFPRTVLNQSINQSINLLSLCIGLSFSSVHG